MQVNKASDDNEIKENKACDVTRTFTQLRRLLCALKPQRFVAKSPSCVTAYLKKHWLHHMCVMEQIENTNRTLLYDIELFRKLIFTVLFPV